MGIINHGILGGIQGSVGNVSGQKSKGRNILTIKPDMANVVKSSIQVVNNDKFNVLRKLYLYSNETINKTICKANPFKESGFNYFTRTNYDNLTNGNILSVNSISVGIASRAKVSLLTAKYNSSKTQVTATWSASSLGIYGSNSTVYVMLYDSTTGYLYSILAGKVYNNGTVTVDVPTQWALNFTTLYASITVSDNATNKLYSTTIGNWFQITNSISTFKWLSNPIYKYGADRAGYFIEDIDYEGSSFTSNYLSGGTSGFTYKGLDGSIMFCPGSVLQYTSKTFIASALVNRVLKSTQVIAVANTPLLPNKGTNAYFSRIFTASTAGTLDVINLFSMSISSGALDSFKIEGTYVSYSISGYRPSVTIKANSTGKPVFFKITAKWSTDANTYTFYLFQLA